MSGHPKQRGISLLSVSAIALLAGCGTALTYPAQNNVFAVTASATHTTTAQPVQMQAALNAGGDAKVLWQVHGDSPEIDAGQINDRGLYTPPAYLDADVLYAGITATLASNHAVIAQYSLAVHPAISISPENVALTPGSETTLYATLAETGGGSLTWSAARTPGGAALGSRFGRFSKSDCHTSANAFTQCSVTFFAPNTLPGNAASLIYAQAADSANPTAFTGTRVLLNTSTLASPLDHEALQPGNAALGTSGGNGNDSAGQYCCGGTLGAVVKIGQDSYILSNNHVLARTDAAALGEAITQPGLTDTQCGYEPSYTVGELSFAPRLRDSSVNVDAAIAKVTPGTVREDGAILGLGATSTVRAPESAPPAADAEDITVAGHALPMLAKSGRSTGLTCAPVSEIAMDVKVNYNTACDGSGDSFTRIFRNQIAVAGAAFSDTGDSGSLVVDQATAQPVGMLYAGSAAETFANPMPDVLAALQPFAQEHGGAATLVGGTHHAVACLNYDALAAHAKAATQLKSGEQERAAAAMDAFLALPEIRAIANPRVTIAPSNDAPGEAALVLHIAPGDTVPTLPAEVNGVRTAIALDGVTATPDLSSLPRTTVDRAIAAKNTISAEWLKDPAILGIGAGISRDNPREAAVIVLVEEGKSPVAMPVVVDGVRVRYQTTDAPRAFHWKQRGNPGLASMACRKPS